MFFPTFYPCFSSFLQELSTNIPLKDHNIRTYLFHFIVHMVYNYARFLFHYDLHSFVCELNTNSNNKCSPTCTSIFSFFSPFSAATHEWKYFIARLMLLMLGHVLLLWKLYDLLLSTMVYCIWLVSSNLLMIST